jgi:tetratricopeptide (TPR) repeat protein
MAERPSAPKLMPAAAKPHEAPGAALAAVDEELRRLGEAVGSEADGTHVAALGAVVEQLRSAERTIPKARLSRRIGMGLVLLGSAREQTGDAEGAASAYREAMDLLAPVGLEDLPAEVLVPYASALVRSADLERAAAAVRQVTRRGYGQNAAPLAVAVADELAAQGRGSEAQALLREFTDAGPMSSIDDDWKLVDALDRHGLSTLAVARCLALAAEIDPSDLSYRKAYVLAAGLAHGDPAVARQCAVALAPVDAKAALDVLDHAVGGDDDPAMTVLRAEILVTSGDLQAAGELLEGSDVPEDAAGLSSVRGLLAYYRDDYRTAFEQLLAAAEQDPDDRRSVLLLGDSARRLPDVSPDELLVVERHLRRVLGLSGRDGITLSVLALVQRARDDVEGSEESLEAAASCEDAPDWVYSEIGERRRRDERYDEALALFERALSSNQADAWTIGSRGQARAALGDVPGAMSDYAEALSLDPTLLWVFSSALEIAAPDSELLAPVARALEDAARDVRQSPSVREEAVRRVAYLLAFRGDSAGALQLLEDAGEYAPRSALLRTSRAWVKRHFGDVDGARADLDEAEQLDASLDWVLDAPWIVSVAAPPLRDRASARLHQAAGDESAGVPARVDLLLEAARSLDSRTEPELVGDLLDRALQLDDTNAKVWAEYGDTLVYRGRGPEAVEAFQQAVRRAPDDPELVAGLGWARHIVGDLDGAARDLRAALKLRRGDYRWASMELAAVLMEISPPEARQIYRQLLRKDPKDVGAARGLSDADVAEGRTGEAMAVLERMLRYWPDDVELRSDIALLALRLEDIGRAGKEVGTLVREHSESVSTWLTKGLLHNQFGEWSEAIEACDRGLALDQTRADLHSQRAWALEYDGQLGQAAAAYEQALRYDADPYLSREHALVLHAMGHPDGYRLLEDALAHTSKVARRDAATLAHVGFCLLALGRFSEGVTQLIQALDVDPTVVAVQLDLALALLASGKTEAGGSERRRALARVGNRHPRRQIGLLRVARVDLALMRRWYPDVEGFDKTEVLIDESLSRAEAALAGSTPQS